MVGMVISIAILVFLIGFLVGDFNCFWNTHFKYRNNCYNCEYFIEDNNTCQLKKVSTNNHYVTKSDMRYCERRKEKDKGE